MPCRNCSCPSCVTLVGSSTPLTAEPPSELIQTNRAATNFEVAQSRITIDSAEKKMSLLEAAMSDLAKQTADIRRVIRLHKAVISPLRAFPPELLVAIFVEYTNMMKNPRTRLSSLKLPLGLMWICSRWRRIVLDTPRFWTRISNSTPMIDFWVNQSKESPLDLYLDLSLNNANLALDALVPQAHRWERIHFILQSNSNSVLSPVRGRLHSLKRLELSYIDTIQEALDFFEEAPQLTKIHLWRVPNPLAVKLPWEQLRDCTFGSSFITLYALQRAKNIQTCHLRMVDCTPWVWSPMLVPHVCHSGLNTLKISYWDPEDLRIDLFFSLLTLLSLQTLELCFPTFESYCPPILAHTLLKFFERSSQHLAILKLTAIPFPPSNLINWFTLMPSLVSLDVGFVRDRYSIDDDFLGLLGSSHPNGLLPRLSFLALRGKASFHKRSLGALIASRRGIELQDVGVAMLETLVLDCTIPRGWSHRESPSFQQFISEGLNIRYGADRGMSDLDSSISGSSMSDTSE